MRPSSLRSGFSLRSRTIRAKLVSGVAIIVGVIAAFILLYFPNSLERQATEALTDKASSMAAMGAYTLAAAVWFADDRGVEEVLQGIGTDPDVHYVLVLDNDGTPIGELGAVEDAWAGPDGHPSRPILRVREPIRFQDVDVGSVHLGLSLEPLQRVVTESRQRAAAISALVFLFGLTGVLSLSTLIAGPLARVVDTAERIARGEVGRRVDLPSDLDLESLARSFNDMVDRLQEAQEDLARSNRDLEERVRARTAELAREVEDRRRAEVALRESEARFRTVFESSLLGIALVDADGRVLDANPAFRRMSGVTEGMPLSDSFDAADRAQTERWLAELRSGVRDVVKAEVRAAVSQGVRGWRHASVSAVRDPQGNLTFVVAMLEDVTEKKQLEERLLQAQKMEAVGRLAGGIAHDFNNLLTTINGTADVALADLEKDHPLREDLTEILDAGARAASLTRQLLAFSRRQMLQPRVLDLNGAVQETAAMLRRLIGADVELDLDLHGEPLTVLADRVQIGQVLMNLAVNARDAMPNGGRLAIRTGLVDVDASASGRYGTPRLGPHAFLAVSDTGHGMDEATRAMAFEPFFTTKEIGKGTGLGLATVYGFVKQSAGGIGVVSQPGEGATFTILLPRHEAAPGEEPPARGEASTAPAGVASGTVLLVEDEDTVRRLLARILEAAGYTVLQAGDGVEGLDVAEAHDGPIDIVITDVVMPEVGGPELARSLATRRPGIKVLFMSGYTRTEVLPDSDGDRSVAFIGKPMSPGELIGAIRDLLEQAAVTI